MSQEIESISSELAIRLEGFSAFTIFVGAIAVAKDRTLVTDKLPLIYLIRDMKELISDVPIRFQPVVEEFDVYQDIVTLGSNTADHVFWRLLYYGEWIRWIWDEGPLKPGDGNYFRGNLYFMNDEYALRFIEANGFTSEELDWLWTVAQRLHCVWNSDVARREGVT